MYGAFRLRAWSFPLVHYIAKRRLSATETAVALRPFYFAVHPDLFGRHPKERAVNEDSLKRLNEYLDNLHDKKRVCPASLKFYVRDINDQPGDTYGAATLREVRISLLSGNIQDTVKTVLRSCNLSLEYVENIPPADGISPSRPIKWHHTFYDHYGVPNPDIAKRRRKPERTLGSWLKKNIDKAQEKQNAIEPIRERVGNLTEDIKFQTGLKDIRWACSWGVTQHQVCLISLGRVLANNPGLSLEGDTIIFGNENGICLRGDIILRCDDVVDNWLKVLRSVRSHETVLAKLPDAERKLSLLLNDIQVIRRPHHPIILAQEYLHQVKTLSSRIQQFYDDDPSISLRGSLSDIELVVDCAEGPLTVSASGQVLVPSSCPAFLIVAFLLSNTNGARHKHQTFLEAQAVEQSLADQVVSQLGLRCLKREENITAEQMETCCKHLLGEPRNLGVRLDGSCIKVTLFYSVMSDGEICIPWNWVGAYDEGS